MPLNRVLVLVCLSLAAPAWAQSPAATTMPPQERPLADEDRPEFQPLRPAEPEDGAAADSSDSAAPAVAVPLPPRPAVPAPLPPAVSPPPLLPAGPPPTVAMPPAPAPTPLWPVLPAWAAALLLVAGAMLSGLLGVLAARAWRRSELAERRRAVAASLAAEMETRRLAFEAVPLPPNVEAGVSFVSAVISMAGIDCAFRTAQGALFLLSPPLVANITVHYAAVQRVADFVKGQSMAAAVRMLQANRLGGHPCPDAGAMREAHVELAAAFRGLDKVILALRAQQR